MMDWDRVRVFHAVAQAGSFTRAAERLGLSQSAISRQIGALEEDLATALFHRHARGLVLTEQGEILLEAADEVAKRMASVETALGDSRDYAAGHLRVNTTIGLGTVWLVGATARLRRASSGDPHLADHRRQRCRPEHARGRRRDPGGAPDPARPDPEAADDRQHTHLRRAELPRAPWRAADVRGSRSPSPDRLRRRHRHPGGIAQLGADGGHGRGGGRPAARRRA